MLLLDAWCTKFMQGGGDIVPQPGLPPPVRDPSQMSYCPQWGGGLSHSLASPVGGDWSIRYIGTFWRQHGLLPYFFPLWLENRGLNGGDRTVAGPGAFVGSGKRERAGESLDTFPLIVLPSSGALPPFFPSHDGCLDRLEPSDGGVQSPHFSAERTAKWGCFQVTKVLGIHNSQPLPSWFPSWVGCKVHQDTEAALPW